MLNTLKFCEISVRDTWCNGCIQLTFISIDVARDSIPFDYATGCSGIESKKQRTKERLLNNSKMEIRFGGRTVANRNPLSSSSQIRFKAAKYFPAIENQLSSLQKRTVLSMVPKGMKRSSKVNAVTQLSSFDDKISLCILRRVVSVEWNFLYADW